ncbi:MAG: hypothetical protein AAF493_17290 [Pseudomonadota bacterium]
MLFTGVVAATLFGLWLTIALWEQCVLDVDPKFGCDASLTLVVILSGLFAVFSAVATGLARLALLRITSLGVREQVMAGLGAGVLLGGLSLVALGEPGLLIPGRYRLPVWLVAAFAISALVLYGVERWRRIHSLH